MVISAMHKSATSTLSMYQLQSRSVLFSLVAILCLTHMVEGFKDGLYSTDTDFVKSLNADTFKTEVIDSRPNLIWIVEFYNSWCGHCIHFAPTWKKLAEEMKDWADLLVIGAIDCSQPVNVKPCRQFDINSYPTMKMFPPMEMVGRLDKVTPIKTQSLPEIKSIILDFMTEFAPVTWPLLKHLDQMSDLWQEKNVLNSQLFIIFEEEKSQIGRQVVLDMRNVTGIKVRMMLKEQVTKFGITEYPSLYKFNPDATYSKLAVGKDSPESDRQAFVKHIKEEMKNSQVNTLKVIPEKQQHNLINVDRTKSSDLKEQTLQPNRNQVNMQDLESALHYSLRQEIAICLTISGERLEALKNYISVLKKYFPGREAVQLFLVEVWRMLANLNSQDFTGEEWMNNLDGLQEENHYLPEVISWASCRGSSPQYRGFPCSMWTLFHVLTVGAYAQSRGRTPGDPREVLLAIRGYMKHFFGCNECSKHFLEMSQSVTSEVTSHTESVLWLWRGHNQVNKRLHGDESEDPKFPKVQFPPRNVCPQCKSADGMKWDEERVLSFLIGFYSEAGIFVPASLQTFHREEDNNSLDSSKNSLHEQSKEKELDWWEKKQGDRDLKHVRQLRLRKRKKSSANQVGIYMSSDTHQDGSSKFNPRRQFGNVRSLWGLTELDLSMCVVFYIISTAIILLLYHHFIIRRHMNPCKNVKAKSLSL